MKNNCNSKYCLAAKKSQQPFCCCILYKKFKDNLIKLQGSNKNYLTVITYFFYMDLYFIYLCIFNFTSFLMVI